MNTVTVAASGRYEVKIGPKLLPTIGQEAANVCPGRTAAIISDSNVFPLYGKQVSESMERAGFTAVSYVFPAGEVSKNGTVYLSILNFLAENHLTRTDCIIALGGGVTGDMAGFVAATYLRGIRYIQVPTTLLAAVDSSVGGKTAIDLPAGKNLAGCFYQPSLVLCDTDTLNTLPEDIFRDGCAEVIKYGILYDEALFSHLAQHRLNFDREQVITRCVELKRDVVMQDEFDTGARMRLNLGHSLGHGVEAAANFTLSHGKAVAIGTAIITRSAAAMGICTEEVRDRILAVLHSFGLPTGTDHAPETIYRCALSDKKRTGNTVNLIIPERIGYCRIQKTPVEEVKSILEAGY